ncbi:MAG: hypothetical protein EAZ92_15375 [Candidatus Kapaibacterium sp.]|nr:MAG: hypothetical protein EAZ92_15375 [Candidatus Kapabacteria bacterium]
MVYHFSSHHVLFFFTFYGRFFMESANMLAACQHRSGVWATFRQHIVSNILVVVGLAFLATSVFAQPPKGTPEQMLERRLGHLSKTLKLSEEQKTKLKPILETSMKEMTKIREEKKGDRKALMAAVQDRMSATEKEISAILTPEQQTKFAKQRENMREKIADRMKERAEKRTAEKEAEKK